MSVDNARAHAAVNGGIRVEVERAAVSGLVPRPAGPVAAPSEMTIQLRVVVDASGSTSRLNGERSVFTAREKAIIGLLAAGLTDEAIARRLGVSKRTVSYGVGRLMHRVGAANRFQLGWALAQLRLPPSFHNDRLSV